MKTNELISNEDLFDWLLCAAGVLFLQIGQTVLYQESLQHQIWLCVKYYSYWIQYLLDFMFNWFDYLVDFYVCLMDLWRLKPVMQIRNLRKINQKDLPDLQLGLSYLYEHNFQVHWNHFALVAVTLKIHVTFSYTVS